jgi:hypothetical protein
MKNEIADALLNTLISPNEADRNMEPANVVDAICRLSREHSIAIREGASEIAEAIRELADAIRASTEA